MSWVPLRYTMLLLSGQPCLVLGKTTSGVDDIFSSPSPIPTDQRSYNIARALSGCYTDQQGNDFNEQVALAERWGDEPYFDAMIPGPGSAPERTCTICKQTFASKSGNTLHCYLCHPTLVGQPVRGLYVAYRWKLEGSWLLQVRGGTRQPGARDNLFFQWYDSSVGGRNSYQSLHVSRQPDGSAEKYALSFVDHEASRPVRYRIAFEPDTTEDTLEIFATPGARSLRKNRGTDDASYRVEREQFDDIINRAAILLPMRLMHRFNQIESLNR